jgi:SAM-dependent methyltransferase
MIPIDQHNVEIERNLASWKRKPVLRLAYRDFHKRIAAHIDRSLNGKIVELGSGIGNIRDVIPGVVRTDLFPNPWIDQVENAYALSFRDEEVSHLILFDVFHHLRHPRTALEECRRVLQHNGRVILFEPYVSVVGRLVYGPLHHEPIGFNQTIVPTAPPDFDPQRDDYYAAQGNATRVFWRGMCAEVLEGWDVIARERIGAWPYALTGGYSKPQLYPTAMYPLLAKLDRLMEIVPSVSALRALVVLRKRDENDAPDA